MLWLQVPAWGWLGGMHATSVLPDRRRRGSGRVISVGSRLGRPAQNRMSVSVFQGEASGAGVVTAALREAAAGPPMAGPSAASQAALPAARLPPSPCFPAK